MKMRNKGKQESSRDGGEVMISIGNSFLLSRAEGRV